MRNVKIFKSNNFVKHPKYMKTYGRPGMGPYQIVKGISKKKLPPYRGGWKSLAEKYFHELNTELSGLSHKSLKPNEPIFAEQISIDHSISCKTNPLEVLLRKTIAS